MLFQSEHQLFQSKSEHNSNSIFQSINHQAVHTYKINLFPPPYINTWTANHKFIRSDIISVKAMLRLQLKL